MKKCFIHIFVAILILSSAFPTFSVSALSSPRIIEPEPQILRDEQVRPDPLGPEAPEGPVFPEPSFQDRMPNADLPEEVRANLLGQTEPVEERVYVPPTAEQLAQTKIQADSFDCTTVTDVLLAECAALVALYNSTNGAGWTGSPGWLTGTTVASWYGVTVTGEHISRLLLYNYQLSGPIPPELGNLPNLVYLDLSGNQLTGSIPSQLGALTNLGHLDLSDNNLTGSIPTELVNLTNIANWGLDLSNNQLNLSGYSQALLDFLALKDPNWEDTQRGGLFTGCAFVTSIPVIECEALVALYDSTNGAEWWNSTNWQEDANPNVWYGVYVEGGKVIELDLEDNNLTGSIPQELGNLTNIANWGLDLSNNQLNLSGYSQALLDFLALKDPDWADTQRGGIFTGCADVTSILEIECKALVALFESTNGEGGWVDSTNWLGDANPNIWNGVSVEGGHVTELDLYGNQLSGRIPSQLGNLTSLTGLYLGGNWLKGSIPSELGKLINLQGLNLSFNQLTGSIPAELGSLANLHGLNLSSNQLTGSIPLSFSNLAELVYFNFDGTLLCEPAAFNDWKLTFQAGYWNGTDVPCISTSYCLPIVSEIPQDQCEALVALYNSTSGPWWGVDHNWFTTPVSEWLGVTLTDVNVTGLNLYAFGMKGNIPPELGTLSSLEYLDLTSNNLSGSIPPEVGSLGSLKELYLGDNQLSGGIPAELGDLTNLSYLSLQKNELTDNIPPELGSLSNLQILDLGSNLLTGSIPTELGSLSNLYELYLYSNQLSGSIPPELGNLLDLIYLSLQENQLTGSIPTELGSLSNLYGLFLYSNQLSGSIPLSFSNLAGLLNFDFSSTNLCEPEDADFLAWEATVDYWSGTGITCPTFDCSTVTNVPQIECEALVALFVSTSGWNWWDHTNWLEDTMIGNWYGVTVTSGHVTVLNLIMNQLTGSIPPQLGNLTNLIELWLGGNQLTGSIPTDLGKLTNLEFLDLSFNQLSGRIPSQLGNLKSLGELWLGYNNQLTGNIPLSFTKLTILNTFSFEDTNLCEPTNLLFQAWKVIVSEGYWYSTPFTCTVPVAVAEAYTTPEDTELVMVAAQGLLANDIGENPLSAELVDNVTNGTLALAADGSFTYTPNLDFTGEDSFTYEATDGELYSDVVTVTIMVIQAYYSIYLPFIIK